MRGILTNRPVLAIAAVFTGIATVLLHANPFGEGVIPWLGAAAVALLGNSVLALIVVPVVAPYMVSSGGKQGAAAASPRAVTIAERWIAIALMIVGVLALTAVEFTSKDLIITPTKQLERNAQLVQKYVELYAPSEFKARVTAADTWKMAENRYRSCVPAGDERRNWCVLVIASNHKLRVTEYGLAKGNAALYLETHPEARQK